MIHQFVNVGQDVSILDFPKATQELLEHTGIYLIILIDDPCVTAPEKVLFSLITVFFNFFFIYLAK